MIEDWGRGESRRQEITAVHCSRSYDEMMAEEAMREMRFTSDAERLLRHAVMSDSLALNDDGAVPCPLNWEMVHAVYKTTGGDFARFKEEIARSIFTFDEEQPPRCRWYESWMAAKQIPLPNNYLLEACGVGLLDLRDIRSVVDDWVAGFIEGQAKRVEYGNRFVWLASLQAREKSSGAMLDAMETLARQVRGDAPAAAPSLASDGLGGTREAPPPMTPVGSPMPERWSLARNDPRRAPSLPSHHPTTPGEFESSRAG